MANENNSVIRNINKQIKNLSDNMNNLYQSTYKTRIDNKKNMDSIIGTIDDNLDSILNTVNNKDISDISSLYIRLQEKESGKKSELIQSIEELFDSNKNIIDSINVEQIHRSIQSENYQYDLICKYMTKLNDALDIKKDNVLSSDNFTKDFVNVFSSKSNKKSIDIFNDNANSIKEKYRLQDLFDDMYWKTSKYGEYFLYHVPYKKALEKLLQRQKQLGLGIKYESSLYESKCESEVIFECTDFKEVKNDSILSELNDKFIKGINDNMKVNVVFDESGIIPKPIQNTTDKMNILSTKTSLTESFIIEQGKQNNKSSNQIVQEVKQGVLLYDNPLSNDGLVGNKNGKEDVKLSDKINGSVIYEIPRENIIPLFIQNEPIGYLHFTVNNTYVDNLVLNGKSFNSLTNKTGLDAEQFDQQNDVLVSYIASELSSKIDAKFINANLDLKEQIYTILRYNDNFCSTEGVNNINVTFLPVEDVHHFYFRLNEKTHRGISDLENSIIPAMIYCLLYLSNVIGNVSRAQDKRVYYVKQNVETNVAKTLLNVINQLKKGNMGMRQLESMNTIFNVIGKYNDHIIPMSQTGDPPITMEVMQGQQIDTPTELMDRMEDAAVTATDVPMEFVQSVNQVDFATRFTMTNSKFLRKIYKRQAKCQEMFSEIFRKLYNFEFNENETSIKILLPAPSFLTMSNSQQLIENIKNYVNAIADIVCNGKSEEIRQEFINICTRQHLGTYVDFTNIDDLLKEAELRLAATESNNDDTSGDEY